MLCILAIIVLGFFFVYLPNTTNHLESISVPDLTGMKVGEIEAFLKDHDLRYEINDSTFQLNKPPSIVLTQYPKAGEKVKENRKIYVTVTTNNPPNVEMPKVVDISLKSAENMLQSYQLQIGNLKYVPHLAQNLVLKQEYQGKEIPAGTRIPKGSTIDLTVADGKGNTEFQIPDVVGKTYEEAKMIIEGSNLVIGSIQPLGTEPMPGSKVVRQRPEAVQGNTIREGDYMDLWLDTQ
jgi:beta-lactam-binding protein with PASTA domain